MAGLVILVFNAEPVDLVAGENPLAVEDVRTLLVGNTIHGIGFLPSNTEAMALRKACRRAYKIYHRSSTKPEYGKSPLTKDIV